MSKKQFWVGRLPPLKNLRTWRDGGQSFRKVASGPLSRKACMSLDILIVYHDICPQIFSRALTYFCWPHVSSLGGQYIYIYTNTARRGPPQTPSRLFGVYVFSIFSLTNKLFGIHQTSFLPVEALEFSELKTPLVYTFFPPNMCPVR